MKFLLIVNDKSSDGFKLSFDATTKEETEICQALAEKLIEKITKIEVLVKNYE